MPDIGRGELGFARDRDARAARAGSGSGSISRGLIFQQAAQKPDGAAGVGGIDAGFGESGFAGDRFHCRGPVTVTHDQPERGVEDLPTTYLDRHPRLALTSSDWEHRRWLDLTGWALPALFAYLGMMVLLYRRLR